jgi:hypothetical protein
MAIAIHGRSPFSRIGVALKEKPDTGGSSAGYPECGPRRHANDLRGQLETCNAAESVQAGKDKNPQLADVPYEVIVVNFKRGGSAASGLLNIQHGTQFNEVPTGQHVGPR